MTVHPHARGERFRVFDHQSDGDGSSPRPWGTHRRHDSRAGLRRFIPTPVGNAAQRTAASMIRYGSSPRPWGTLVVTARAGGLGRFIPTPVGNAWYARGSEPSCTVHPHARGERLGGSSGCHESSGSSPRPWGTPGADGLGILEPRFIPTPVGNARAGEREKRRLPVHPHARGERRWHHAAGRRQTGSSPRPWGTPVASSYSWNLIRFIPTPVGNAGRVVVAAMRIPVHPHARGERMPMAFKARKAPGSSPRPWGTPSLIPPPPPDAPVHPHARGERKSQRASFWCCDGSSPRPWGTPRCRRGRAGCGRFIPTPVGNAWSQQPGSRTPAVHPHARGERFGTFAAANAGTGSSPRPWGTPRSARPRPTSSAVHPHARGERSHVVCSRRLEHGSSPRPWGTHLLVLVRGIAPRFIPTPVGNASRSGARCSAPPVHPHARGERGPCPTCGGKDRGSSPRPWGTPHVLLDCPDRDRFIPTPVGNASG